MKIIKEIEFSKYDVDRIKCGIHGLFDININDKQFKTLINIFKYWDCRTDSLSLDELFDMIGDKFIGIKPPRYGDSDEYKARYWEIVNSNRNGIIKYLNSYINNSNIEYNIIDEYKPTKNKIVYTLKEMQELNIKINLL